MPASMIVGRGEAKAMATKQKASQVITKKARRSWPTYLLSRLCTVDATTMRVCLVNGHVVPPFAEGATLPYLDFLADPPGIALAI